MISIYRKIKNLQTFCFPTFFFGTKHPGETPWSFGRSWGMGKAAGGGGLASGSHFVVMDLRSFFFIGANIWMFPKIGVFPPKWMVKIMENPIKMDDLGGKPTIFGNIHIWSIFWIQLLYGATNTWNAKNEEWFNLKWWYFFQDWFFGEGRLVFCFLWVCFWLMRFFLAKKLGI